MEDPFKEVREKVPVADVLGVSLDKKRMALCSLHDDHRPSLYIDESQNLWYCFACEIGGSPIDAYLVKEMGLSDPKKASPSQTVRAAKALAEEYGVDFSLEDVDEERLARRKEVFDCLATTVRLAHEALPQEMRNDIKVRRGFSDQTIDKLKIGFLSSEVYNSLVSEFGIDILKDSGLVTESGVFFLKGRIFYPYWKHGRVVYGIARATEYSLDSQAKYKKIKTTDHVENVIFNEVSAYSVGRLLITEGVTDCISLMEEGFSAISPVTIRFKREDMPKIADYAKRADSVYILHDNERSKEGEKSALELAEYLFREHGIEAKVAFPPREESDEKVDVNSHLASIPREGRKQTVERILQVGRSIIDVKLANIEGRKDVEEFIKLLAGKPPLLQEDIISRLAESSGFRKDTLLRQLSIEEGIKESHSEKKEKKWIAVAEDILSKHHIVTHEDSRVMYLYEDGVYKPRGEVACQMEAQEELGKEVSSHAANEIVNYVMRKTYTRSVEFNNPKHLLNLENGLLYMEEGKVREHSPEYISTTQLPVKYDPEVDCPRWKEFLSEVIPEGQLRTVQDMAGCCLLKSYDYGKFFILLGEGANGKSTFLAVLRMLLGKENVSSETIQDLERNVYSKAGLSGKLANLCGDLPQRKLPGAGTIKQLTGGDLIRAERKYQHSFTFENYATLIFSANKLPRISDETYALYSRIIIIDFPNKFVKEPDPRNPHEKERRPRKEILGELKEELPGILNWALGGLERVKKRGEVSSAETVKERAEKYKMASDSIWLFAQERLRENPDHWEKRSEVYMEYGEFCRKNGFSPESQQIFSSRLPQVITTSMFRPHTDEGRRVRAWRDIELVNGENSGEGEDRGHPSPGGPGGPGSLLLSSDVVARSPTNVGPGGPSSTRSPAFSNEDQWMIRKSETLEKNNKKHPGPSGPKSRLSQDKLIKAIHQIYKESKGEDLTESGFASLVFSHLPDEDEDRLKTAIRELAERGSLVFR